MEVLTAAALIPDPDSGNDYCELIYDVITNKAKHIDYEKVVAVCITYPGLYLERSNVVSLAYVGEYKA